MTQKAPSSDRVTTLVELFKHCQLSVKKRLLKEVSVNGIISGRDIAKMVPIRLTKQPNKLEKTMNLLLVLLGVVGIKVTAKTDEGRKNKMTSNLADESLQISKDNLKFYESKKGVGGGDLENIFEKKHDRKANLPDKDILSLYLAEVRKFKILTRPAVYLLTSNYRAYRNISSRNKIVEHNLRFAANRARRYLGRGIEYLDLIQEANIGLIVATEFFEDERNFSFSTYAFNWVEHFLKRAIQNKSHPFRIPIHAQESFYKIAKAVNKLLEEDLEPHTSEVAKLTGISQEAAELISDRMKKMKTLLSLDDKDFADDSEAELHECVPEKKDLNPEEITIVREELDMESKLLAGIIKEIKKFSCERDFDIFVARYGLNDSLKKKTLEEIGKNHNVSRERIRQITEAILKKSFNELKEGGDNEEGPQIWFEKKLRKIETLQNITGLSFDLSPKVF